MVFRELNAGQDIPRYTEAREQRFHSAPFQRSASSLEVLQAINLQRPAHQQAPRAPFMPNTFLPRESRLEVLMVELLPLRSGEEPPPPYSREQPPPPYPGESPPYFRVEPLPPYLVFGGKSLKAYAVTTLV